MLSLAEFNDIGGMFMDAERMVRECSGSVYGYMRVSTANQDCERQNEALGALGIPEENIFMDKKSGKDFDRPGFKALLEKVREGDLVVIKTLDRFGRSVKEIQEQLWNITGTKKVGIAFIDSPFLNRSDDLPPMAFMLSSMMYLMFSFSAEVERVLIVSRTEEGRRIAMQNGVRFGRKPLPIPKEFWEMREDVKSRKIKKKWAAEKLGVDRKTLYKWMRQADEAERADEAEQTNEVEQAETKRASQDALETASRTGAGGIAGGCGSVATAGEAIREDGAGNDAVAAMDKEGDLDQGGGLVWADGKMGNKS